MVDRQALFYSAKRGDARVSFWIEGARRRRERERERERTAPSKPIGEPKRTGLDRENPCGASRRALSTTVQANDKRLGLSPEREPKIHRRDTRVRM
jgi:hypothetical protein